MLKFMGEHPVLTFLLVVIVISGLVEIVKALKGIA